MPNCWSKKTLELGFILGDIPINQAKKIGGEISGEDYFNLSDKCKMFTDVSPKRNKLLPKEIYPTLF